MRFVLGEEGEKKGQSARIYFEDHLKYFKLQLTIK